MRACDAASLIESGQEFHSRMVKLASVRGPSSKRGEIRSYSLTVTHLVDVVKSTGKCCVKMLANYLKVLRAELNSYLGGL